MHKLWKFSWHDRMIDPSGPEFGLYNFGQNRIIFLFTFIQWRLEKEISFQTQFSWMLFRSYNQYQVKEPNIFQICFVLIPKISNSKYEGIYSQYANPFPLLIPEDTSSEKTFWLLLKWRVKYFSVTGLDLLFFSPFFPSVNHNEFQNLWASTPFRKLFLIILDLSRSYEIYSFVSGGRLTWIEILTLSIINCATWEVT